jgi:hypothetical protein
MGTHWHDMAHGIRTQITIPPLPRPYARRDPEDPDPEAGAVRPAGAHCLGKRVDLTHDDVQFRVRRGPRWSRPGSKFHRELAKAIAAAELDRATIPEAVRPCGDRYALEAMLVVAFYRMVSPVTKPLRLDR